MSIVVTLLGLTALVWVSIPLAIMAVMTTALAFSALFLRVSIVYIELAMALLYSWTSKIPSPPPTARTPRRISPSASSIAMIQGRARASRGKTSNTLHNLQDTHAKALDSAAFKGGNSSSFVGAGEPTRDFEGVGGWHLTGNGDDESIWMTMNSRLELPSPGGQRQRRHMRSLSSESTTFTPRSPEASRSSPSLRTPYKLDDSTSTEEYFNLPTATRHALTPEERMARNRMEERRMSVDLNKAATTAAQAP